MGLLVVVAPADPLAQTRELGDRPRGARASHEAIALSFRPVAVEQLAVGKPKNQWLKAKTVQFWPVPKVHEDDCRQQPAVIHLFVDPTDKGVDMGGVYGFLEDHSVLYDLGSDPFGNVCSYGVVGVRIATAKLTTWDAEEVVLEGGLGAACDFTEILGFDPRRKQWVRLLTMYGTPQRVATYGGDWVIFEQSPGELPPWLNIYRWSNDHFEQAEVVQDTGDGGAEFLEDKGTIKTQRYDAKGRTVASHYWRYDNGKLILVRAKERSFLFRKGVFGH